MNHKKFAISFINFFDNHLDMQMVLAETAADAMRCYLRVNQGWNTADLKDFNEREIRIYVADCDCAIAYLEI